MSRKTVCSVVLSLLVALAATDLAEARCCGIFGRGILRRSMRRNAPGHRVAHIAKHVRVRKSRSCNGGTCTVEKTIEIDGAIDTVAPFSNDR